MKTTKKIQILKLLKKKPKSGCSTWDLNMTVRTNDTRKRISELINNDGIKIKKRNVKLDNGTICVNYCLVDPDQPEIAELLEKYSGKEGKK